MTEIQIKDFLNGFIIIQQEIEILKNYISNHDSELMISKYKKREFYIYLLLSALKTLDEKERFVIEKHLINRKTWLETTELYEEKFGVSNGRSERTLKRMQSKAIKKLSDFINKLPIELEYAE